MRPALVLASILLTTGCHARFKRAAPSIDAVRADVYVSSLPTVTLPGVGGDDAVAAVVNITQSVRAGNIARHLRDKVDPDRVNAAFARGFAQALGTGPPFAHDGNAQHVLEYELVDWGLEIVSPVSPGVFTYSLRVRGVYPDGRRFYKSGVTCVTDAGMAGWSEMTPFGDNNPNRIKNLPAQEIQRIFDETAADCAFQAVALLRKHASR